jgi:hypothetical protein
MKKRIYSLIILLALSWSAVATPVKVCSFNVQWLGLSAKRDNHGLVTLLKDFDVVVIEELVAPPYAGTFPDGSPYKPDPESASFFDEMKAVGFKYAMSEEDTGPGLSNHNNGAATEWWVAFFKPGAVVLAADLPTGFLSKQLSHNPDWERVPFAFGFRTPDQTMDFVLIPVHLRPNAGSASKARRRHELAAIKQWIDQHSQHEKDFIILGDMNIENAAELNQSTPQGLVSLNKNCTPTNTNVKKPKPYDHAMYSPVFTKEMDTDAGFGVVSLIPAMEVSWKAQHHGVSYPGQPKYFHDAFRAYYSDHNPVFFRLTPSSAGDDDH